MLLRCSIFRFCLTCVTIVSCGGAEPSAPADAGNIPLTSVYFQAHPNTATIDIYCGGEYCGFQVGFVPTPTAKGIVTAGHLLCAERRTKKSISRYVVRFATGTPLDWHPDSTNNGFTVHPSIKDEDLVDICNNATAYYDLYDVGIIKLPPGESLSAHGIENLQTLRFASKPLVYPNNYGESAELIDQALLIDGYRPQSNSNRPGPPETAAGITSIKASAGTANVALALDLSGSDRGCVSRPFAASRSTPGDSGGMTYWSPLLEKFDPEHAQRSQNPPEDAVYAIATTDRQFVLTDLLNRSTEPVVVFSRRFPKLTDLATESAKRASIAPFAPGDRVHFPVHYRLDWEATWEGTPLPEWIGQLCN